MSSFCMALLLSASVIAQSKEHAPSQDLDHYRAMGPKAVPALLAQLSLTPDFGSARSDAPILLLLAGLGPEARSALPRLLLGLVDDPEDPWRCAERLPELWWTLGELSVFDRNIAEQIAIDPTKTRFEHLACVQAIAGFKVRYGPIPDDAAIERDLGSNETVIRAAAAARARDVRPLRASSAAALRANFWGAWQARRDYWLNWHDPKQWLLVESAGSLATTATTGVDAVAARIALLRHPSPWVRRDAAQGLLTQGADLTWLLRDLIPVLQDPDLVVVDAVLQLLGSSGSTAEPVLEILATLDTHGHAALAGRVTGARERLRAVSKHEGSAHQRSGLATTLLQPRIDGEAFAPMLAAGVEVADVPILLEALRYVDPKQATSILRAMATLGSAANRWPALRTRLETLAARFATVSPQVLADTVAALTVDPNADEDALLAWCDDANPVVRRLAFEALGQRQALSPAAATALARALREPQPSGWTVNTVLGEQIVLDFNCADELRVALAKAVITAALPHARRAEAAGILLREGDEDLRLLALHALGTLDDITPALDDVIAVLRCPRDQPVLLAITALQRAGRAATKALLELGAIAVGEDEVARAAAAAGREIRAALPLGGRH